MTSLPTRSLSQHIRHSIHPSQSGSQSPALIARIEEKKAELENLKELRDLSAAVAAQMEALQQKLATVSHGTEAIAAVLGNWHNVLRAINMASSKLPNPKPPTAIDDDKSDPDAEDEDEGPMPMPMPLPQTLVRIPTEHAPAVQAHAEIDTTELEGASAS